MSLGLVNLLKSHKSWLIVWKLVYCLLTCPGNGSKEQKEYLASCECSTAKATMMINPEYIYIQQEEDGESQMLCEKFSGIRDVY